MILLFFISLIVFFFLQKQVNRKLARNHGIGYVLDKSNEFYYYVAIMLIGVIFGVFFKGHIDKNIILILENNLIIFIYILSLIPFIISFYLLYTLNYKYKISIKNYKKHLNEILFINVFQFVLFFSFLVSTYWITVIFFILIGIQYFRRGRDLIQMHKKIKCILIFNLILANVITASIMMHFTILAFENSKIYNVRPINYFYSMQIENLNKLDYLPKIDSISSIYIKSNDMIIFYLALIEIAFLILNYISMLIITYLDFLFGIFIQDFALLIGKNDVILDLGILKSIDDNFIDFLSVKKHVLPNWFLLKNIMYNKNEVKKIRKSENLIYNKSKEEDNITIEFD